MQTRTRLLAFTLVCLLYCNACGSALYFKQSRVTRRAFQNAQSSGAKIVSPYEYYCADDDDSDDDDGGDGGGGAGGRRLC